MLLVVDVYCAAVCVLWWAWMAYAISIVDLTLVVCAWVVIEWARSL